MACCSRGSTKALPGLHSGPGEGGGDHCRCMVFTHTPPRQCCTRCRGTAFCGLPEHAAEFVVMVPLLPAPLPHAGSRCNRTLCRAATTTGRLCGPLPSTGLSSRCRTGEDYAPLCCCVLAQRHSRSHLCACSLLITHVLGPARGLDDAIPSVPRLLGQVGTTRASWS